MEVDRWKIPLKTHVCTAEELGFGNTPEEAILYPVADDFVADAKRLIGLWHCFDKEQDKELRLWGSYDASSTQSIRINLNVCDNQNNTCLDTDLKAASDSFYIALLHNEKSFDQTREVGEQVQEQAKIDWVHVDPHYLASVHYNINKKRIHLDDSLFSGQTDDQEL